MVEIVKIRFHSEVTHTPDFHVVRGELRPPQFHSFISTQEEQSFPPLGKRKRTSASFSRLRRSSHHASARTQEETKSSSISSANTLHNYHKLLNGAPGTYFVRHDLHSVKTQLVFRSLLQCSTCKVIFSVEINSLFLLNQ